MPLPSRSYVQIPFLEYQPHPLLRVQQPPHHLLAVEGHEPVPLAVPALGDDARVLNRTKSLEEVEEIPLLDAIPQPSNIDPVVDKLYLVPVVPVPLPVVVSMVLLTPELLTTELQAARQECRCKDGRLKTKEIKHWK